MVDRGGKWTDVGRCVIGMPPIGLPSKDCGWQVFKLGVGWGK